MKMRAPVVFLFGVAAVAGFAWLTYPTGLESELKTFRTLSSEEYMAIRASAIAFARERAASGITISPGTERAQVFELQCKSVPLLLVENGYDLALVDVFGYADRRAPGIEKLVHQMDATFVPEGRPGRPGPISGEPAGLEAFIMKHRDGIDIADKCE